MEAIILFISAVSELFFLTPTAIDASSALYLKPFSFVNSTYVNSGFAATAEIAPGFSQTYPSIAPERSD